MTTKRCTWVAVDDPLMLRYHDREWGVPVHDDCTHFELLVLEAAQAGLSWAIVLRKREGYRRAFSQFDPEKVARFTAKRIQKLTLDPSIIRNRMKIEAAVRNARAFLVIQQEFGSFDAYCWRFVDGRPKLNRWKATRQIPATSLESDLFSKDLKGRGFSFVGSTIIYAHMQAVGMVNDHLIDCFRHREVRRLESVVGRAPYRAARPPKTSSTSSTPWATTPTHCTSKASRHRSSSYATSTGDSQRRPTSSSALRASSPEGAITTRPARRHR